MNGLAVTIVVGRQLATMVHLGPGDVAVHVDPAGHDDHSRGVDVASRPDRGIGRRPTIDPSAIQRSRTCPSMPFAGS